jgi:hypothetical protein
MSLMTRPLTQHLPVLPVLLPALHGDALLLLGDGGDSHAQAPPCRAASALAVGGAGPAVRQARLLEQADGAPAVYRLGDWPAPFGIVLVIDRLSALMLVLTSWSPAGAVVCQRRLGQSRPPLPRPVPVPADGPERCLRHRRPVQPVRVLRGAADRLYVLMLHGQGKSGCASACTTWCSTWRRRPCS